MTLARQQTIARLAAFRSLGMAARRRRVPRARPPKLVESDYAARLVGQIERLRAPFEAALPAILAGLPAGVRQDENPAARGRRLAGAARLEAEGRINLGQTEESARKIARRVADHQRGEFTRQTQAALGIDPVLFDPDLPVIVEGFVHENVALIRSLGNRTLDELETLIARAYADGTRAEAVAIDVAKRFDIAERHARLIARDQIGKIASQVTVARHLELGLDSFWWRSMGDGKVRPRHRELHGKRFLYAKPPAEGLPGRPVCCRCLPEPDFTSLYEEAGIVAPKSVAITPSPRAQRRAA